MIVSHLCGIINKKPDILVELIYFLLLNAQHRIGFFYHFLDWCLLYRKNQRIHLMLDEKEIVIPDTDLTSTLRVVNVSCASHIRMIKVIQGLFFHANLIIQWSVIIAKNNSPLSCFPFLRSFFSPFPFDGLQFLFTSRVAWHDGSLVDFSLSVRDVCPVVHSLQVPFSYLQATIKTRTVVNFK